MSSGCGDVLSLEDLKIARKHQIFEAEVITGLSGGVAGGSPIDYATNQVTGQVQKTLPAVLRDAGFRPAAFTFTSGGTLPAGSSDVAVLWPISSGGDGNYYVWKGSLPKVIPAASTPTSTGGVSSSAWMPVGDITLRKELADSSSSARGAGLIGVKQPFSNSVPMTQLDKNRESISVMDFGAKGDGVTDDTVAVQKALDSGFSRIMFPVGYTFSISTVTVTVRGQTLTGGGNIKGTVAVAMPKGTDIYTTIIAETSITGLTFSAQSSTTNSILLRRGRGIRISDCTFREVNCCVIVKPTAADYDGGSHCIEDVMILNNTATLVNYFLYGDTSAVVTSGVNWWMGCGDITVSKNICRVSKISFVHADRMDGLLVEGNAMLNWGYAGAIQGKLYGVYVSTQGAQIVITGNNIFETGYEGIRLINCASVVIDSNNIVQCGQLKPSSAIYVSNLAAGTNTFISIQNNLINEITSHPITVSNTQIGTVQGNIAYIGPRTYYYGTTTLPSVDVLYLVNMEGTNALVTVESNTCYELITRGISAAAVGRTRTASFKYDLSTAATSIDGTASRVHLVQPAATTITSVTGGFDGQEITLISYNGNTTIGDASTNPGGNILTSTGANMTIPVNRIFKLFRSGSSWYLK